jgi:hypothetical protein
VYDVLDLGIRDGKGAIIESKLECHEASGLAAGAISKMVIIDT